MYSERFERKRTSIWSQDAGIYHSTKQLAFLVVLVESHISGWFFLLLGALLPKPALESFGHRVRVW